MHHILTFSQPLHEHIVTTTDFDCVFHCLKSEDKLLCIENDSILGDIIPNGVLKNLVLHHIDEIETKADMQTITAMYKDKRCNHVRCIVTSFLLTVPNVVVSSDRHEVSFKIVVLGSGSDGSGIGAV